MMEQPIVNTKDERVIQGNLSEEQIKEMRSHNLYTTIKNRQVGWEFHGVGKTDTYTVPWNFTIDDKPYFFVAIQHKNLFGTDQIIIFMADKKFTFDLNVMGELKIYIGHIDLFTTIEMFVAEFQKIIEDIES